MCLGGGGYEPPKRVPAPLQVAGGPPPDDMVNGQVIPNANDRSQMQNNQNALDPKLGNNKQKLQVQSDRNPGMM